VVENAKQVSTVPNLPLRFYFTSQDLLVLLRNKICKRLRSGPKWWITL